MCLLSSCVCLWVGGGRAGRTYTSHAHTRTREIGTRNQLTPTPPPPPPNRTHTNRRAQALQKVSQLKAATAALRQSELFKLHDDGEEAAVLMASLEPGKAAHASEFVVFCVFGGSVLDLEPIACPRVCRMGTHSPTPTHNPPQR
jgi:hypothetical protein